MKDSELIIKPVMHNGKQIGIDFHGELVRCRDCEWYGIAELKQDGTVDMRYKPSFCYLWKNEMAENDYCSMAERKESQMDEHLKAQGTV